MKPIWESETNKKGGRFLLWTNNAYINRFWEELALAFIGMQLDTENDIVGIVVSRKRPGAGVLAIWNRNALDYVRIERTK